MIDYLIIGSGLAGIAFAETALNNNKSVLVIDNDSNSSSKVAGGLYNPVILKRFTPISNAQELLDELTSFYTILESKLGIRVDFKMPILRKFFSIEEQNNWFVASDKKNLASFLSTNLITKKIFGLDSPFDFGEVKQTGYVDVALLVEKYKSYLLNNNLFLNDSFDYSILKSNSNGIEYKDILARHIVFAEGFGVHSNPYFNHLPLDGTKGELLIIKAPKLDLNVIVNTSVFILPLGDNLFKVGATYNWEDKSNAPTEEGKKELIDRIKEILNCDFQIISHYAGVRPTVRDRKPLIGTHNIFRNIHILNGLGTRGVMLGPLMAKILYKHIESGVPLPKDINIERYEKKK